MKNVSIEKKVYKQVYEDFDWQDLKLTDELKTKIQLILTTIPNNVNNIIDIGCGNGLITNVLSKSYDVLGVDISENALKNVYTRTLQSSSSNVDVNDSSFDLVFSSELLEHLLENDYLDTISEMKRIASNYIFLTFPNSETIEKNYVKCKNCKHIFNKSHHLRSINVDKIMLHFTGWEIVTSFQQGAGVRPYNKLLLHLKHKFAKSDSWIPNYMTKNSNRKWTCSNCGESYLYNYKYSIFGSLLDYTNILFSPKKPYWQYVLLKKS
jgi:ubiquinone/menaquinone biosynthesis C-methylase UbiE